MRDIQGDFKKSSWKMELKDKHLCAESFEIHSWFFHRTHFHDLLKDWLWGYSANKKTMTYIADPLALWLTAKGSEQSKAALAHREPGGWTCHLQKPGAFQLLFNVWALVATGFRSGEGWGGCGKPTRASHYRAGGTGDREHLALITEQRDRVLENRVNLGQRYLTLPQVL